MKTLTMFLVILVAILLGGCYTQFVVTRDEPEAVAETPQPVTAQPPPVVIIVEPIPNPEPPPDYAPPVVAVPSPAPVMQTPPESPRRDIGNNRTGPGTETNTRPIGQDRKAR